jgi:hypothetical protein
MSKTNEKNILFLVGISESLTRAGSGAGSGSVNQVYGSKDPDPYKNATSLEHWFQQSAGPTQAGRAITGIPKNLSCSTGKPLRRFCTMPLSFLNLFGSFLWLQFLLFC